MVIWNPSKEEATEQLLGPLCKYAADEPQRPRTHANAYYCRNLFNSTHGPELKETAFVR